MPRPNRGASLKWLAKRQSWYIVWYESGRERLRATGCTDRIDAEKALIEHIGDSHKNHSGPREPSEVLITEVLDWYGSEHAPNVADPARIGYAISALLTYWSKNNVQQITKATCLRYAKERKKKPATIRRELTTLRAAINYAVAEGYLSRPVPVPLPDKPDAKDRWLTFPEAARLLNASRTGRADVRLYLPLFVLIGLYTGARKEAILSLKWPQVDLKAARIDFKKPDAKITNKRRAKLPIPNRLLPFLRYAWARRSSDIGPVIHDKGNPIEDIGQSFMGAAKRAGLADVTPHTLRHTRGTWSAQAGVDLWKIAGWLGQSLATTTELYAHHHPDFMEDAKNAADRRKR